MRHYFLHPFRPLLARITRVALTPIGSHIGQGMPLGTFHETLGRKKFQRLVRLARCVILEERIMNQLDAWVESYERFWISMLDRTIIDLRDGVVKMDMPVTSIEPP